MRKRSKKNLAVRNQIFLSCSQLILNEISDKKNDSLYSSLTLKIDELHLLNRLVKFKSKGNYNLELDKGYKRFEDQLYNEILKKNEK